MSAAATLSTILPNRESSVPTREQIDAWADAFRAEWQDLHDAAEARDRGLDAAMRGRRARRPERLASEDA